MAAVPAPAEPATIDALASRIRTDHHTDYDRARAVYEWVARNVAYDVAAHQAGGAGDMSAEAVFARRTAVCEGFASLFIEIARRTGLHTEKVSGYAKGFDHVPGRSTATPNHAWVAFRIGHRWHLADPTWGAGHIIDGAFEPAYTPWYFDVPPDALILSHLPEEPRWQLLRHAVRRRDFEQMATVPAALLALGFSSAGIRSAALDRQHPGFPLAYAIDSGLTVVEAPLSGQLATDRSYDFELLWPAGLELFVVVDESWTRLEPVGDGRFRGSVKSTGGDLTVVGRRSDVGSELQTVLVYAAN